MQTELTSTDRAAELRTIAAALRKLNCALDCRGDLADDLPDAIAGIKPFPNPFPPLPRMESEARGLLMRAVERGAFADAGTLALRAHFDALNPLRLSYLWLASNGGSDTLLRAQEELIGEGKRECERTGPPFSRVNEIPEHVAARALATLIEALAVELELEAKTMLRKADADRTREPAGEKPAERAKPHWTQAEVDAEIRDLIETSKRKLTALANAVRQGKPGAVKAFRGLFGRNTLAGKLECAAGLISKSRPWLSVVKPLGLAGRRPGIGRGERVGAEIAYERSALAGEGARRQAQADDDERIDRDLSKKSG